MTSLKMFSYSALILVVIHGINCQVPLYGECPQVDPQQNFDMKKWSGSWYLVEAYHTEFLKGGKCIQQTFSTKPDGSVAIDLKQIDSKTEKSSTLKGSAKVVGDNDDGALQIKIFNTSFNGVVNVIDTDYQTYTLNSWCEEDKSKKNFMKTMVWIEARKPQLPDDLKQKLYKVMEQIGFNARLLMKINQKNCS
ncbi:hypothetical protein HHI36_000837 [Cryptolaemus montrouzieri]|uniref:Lipocalin/cytosolic fatty-acid binding domain-containing protein n=1 Tax=Cryptolaemus montrouzieri TaxID=559131 RepID=A0ABD2P680_9CUCU